jgi:hypothetical protein
MPLFRHHHDAPDPGRLAPPSPNGLSGLAGFAAGRGWPSAGERPFDGHLEDAVAASAIPAR